MTRQIDRRRAVIEGGALSAATLCPPSRSLGANEWEGFDDLYVKPPWYPDGPRALEDAPSEISTGGRLRLGLFREPCRKVNLLEANLFKGGPRRWWGGPRLQEWVGFGFAHPRWYFGMIMMDLKAASVSSVYALDMDSGDNFSYDAVGNSSNSGVPETLWNGRTYSSQKNFHLEFIHDLDHGLHRINIEMPAGKNKPSLQMDLELKQDLKSFQPLVVSMPLYPRHYIYTHKTVMGIDGRVRVGGEEVEYSADERFAILDEFRAFWPIPRRWTWGTGEGKTLEGRSIAFNAVDYYARDQEYWNENCLWIDGKISFLDAVKWDHDPRSPDKPWTLRENSGRLEARFTPEGGKMVNLAPLPFKYYQKCGRLEGFAVDEDGRRREFENLYGPAENGRIG